MNSLAIVSLLAIFVAIVLGFARKTNVGIISISLALILGRIYGLSDSELMSGFSTNLFITMVGVTYLFGILNENGTLHRVADLIVHQARGRNWLLPIAMYLMGFVLTAVGPGSIPILAIIPVIAVPIAISAGLNPLMLAIIGQCGCFGGRMTTITPEGVLVQDLLAQQQLGAGMVHLWASLFVASLVLAVMVFVFYKGWQTKPGASGEQSERVVFHRNHIISLIGLLAMILCALVFSVNVGLISFLVGCILVLLGVAHEGASIKKIPWNTLLLVVGVGILMKIVTNSGGIDLLADAMTAMMTPRTASTVMAFIAGIMSFFSSGIGVVFPTLIPTVGGISANFSGAVSPVELAAAVVIGGTVPGLSPISTTGALIMAAVESDKVGGTHYNMNKIFLSLWGWAFGALLLCCLLALVGVYAVIC